MHSVTVRVGPMAPTSVQPELGPESEILLKLLAEARETLRSAGISTEGLGWQDALDSGILDLVLEGRTAEAKERL